MFRFHRAFMRSSRALDARVDEWLEALREDTPQAAPAVAPPQRQTRGAHRRTTVFESLNSSRST
jgi:ketosteroid isomerase-like protein